MQDAELKFRSYLASQKLKYTAERQKVFSEIVSSPGHFGPDELIARLGGAEKRVSRATIYRTLDLLVKLGIVRRVCFGDKGALYESNLNWKPTGEIVCLGCGNVVTFEVPDSIDATLRSIANKYETAAMNRSVQVFGYCKDCGDGHWVF